MPRQSWISAPTVTANAYHDIMSSDYQANLYHWDNAAQAAATLFRRTCICERANWLPCGSAEP